MTKGHVGIVERLVERFDRVIVLPCYLSPHKIGRHSGGGEHRIKMLRLALGRLGVRVGGVNGLVSTPAGLVIDGRELDRGGVSYTVDTIRELRGEYPNDELWFVVGGDSLAALHTWYNWDELRGLCNFLVVGRDKWVIDDIRLDGTIVELADFVGEDVSSSYARVLNAVGRIDEAVPKSVAEYIKSSGLYNDYRYIADRYNDYGLSPRRIAHTVRAAKEAVDLAKVHRESISDSIIATMLHDIAKDMDIVGYDDVPKPCRHALIGAKIALRDFGVSEDIAKAIAQHTTGAPNMSRLAKIVYLADYIEIGRAMDGLGEVRQAAYKDLDIAMHLALGKTLRHLRESGGRIDQNTIRAWEWYDGNRH